MANKFSGTQFNRNNKTEEEYRADCSRGGKASQEKQRRKRSMQEAMRMVLDANLKDISKLKVKKIKADLVALGCPDDDLTFNSAIALKAAVQAAKGDIESARFCRDTSGQSPTAKIAVGSVQDFEDLDLSKLSREELMKLVSEEDE